MSATTPIRESDRKKAGRRKHPPRTDIKDLELAGGVEGGMEAGSAGGPGQADVERSNDKHTGR